MDMYDETMDTSFYNISIDGYDLVAEEISPNESYNRRETSRHDIIGGTQRVVRTTYIPREYSITTHVRIDPTEPDIYDDVFRDWMSKNVEVISKYIGGSMKAECVVKVDPNDSPNYLKLEINLTEIPDEKSLIPGEEFNVPDDVISPVKISTSSSKSSDKSKKDKTNKSSKTTKKGSNITKTKKSSK